MKRLWKGSLSLLVAVVCSMAVYSAAFAESEAPEGGSAQQTETIGEEADNGGDQSGQPDPAAFFEGLDQMEVHELFFKAVKTEVVAGNNVIAEDHFRTLILFQNISPYALRSPATAIEISDKRFNSLALKYIKLDTVLKPGESKLVPIELESLVEVTAGESTKNYKAEMYDVLYAERANDVSELTKSGVYFFINSKQLKVKIADPHGYQYVPAKELFEALGFKYIWNAKTSTFIATKDKMKIEHKIKTRNMKVNDKIVKIDGGDTTFVGKVPSVSVNVLPLISNDWILNKGYHSDITMVTFADKSIVK